MAERKQKRITVEPVSMSVVSLDKHGHLQHTKFDEAVSVSFGLVSVTGAELKEAVTVWLASMAGKEAARQAGVMVDAVESVDRSAGSVPRVDPDENAGMGFPRDRTRTMLAARTPDAAQEEK